MGDYNPDWAIVRRVDGEDKLYMIRETKSVEDEWLLRPSEKAKISAARNHFEVVGVDFAKSSPADWRV